MSYKCELYSLNQLHSMKTCFRPLWLSLCGTSLQVWVPESHRSSPENRKSCHVHNLLDQTWHNLLKWPSLGSNDPHQEWCDSSLAKRKRKTLGNFHTTCPLSLSVTHHYLIEEEMKGWERGRHSTIITQLDRDKAGLCTKASTCMSEQGGEQSNKGTPASIPPWNTPGGSCKKPVLPQGQK